jgi:hypothetical protein
MTDPSIPIAIVSSGVAIALALWTGRAARHDAIIARIDALTARIDALYTIIDEKR